MYVVHPSLSQKCVASACLIDVRHARCDALFTTHVIPFPNQEWVSSCTTTSTRLRSPARRAGAPYQKLTGYPKLTLTGRQERQTSVFLLRPVNDALEGNLDDLPSLHKGRKEEGPGRRKLQIYRDRRYPLPWKETWCRLNNQSHEDRTVIGNSDLPVSSLNSQ